MVSDNYREKCGSGKGRGEYNLNKKGIKKTTQISKKESQGGHLFIYLTPIGTAVANANTNQLNKNVFVNFNSLIEGWDLLKHFIESTKHGVMAYAYTHAPYT